MAKKKTVKNQKSFEETLWDSANKLRGKVESSEYKHVVLGLIFLKFASDKFEKRKQELVKEGKEQNQGVGYLEDGTMVVVENARKLVGKNINVEVTSILQSPSGRIVFTKLAN